MDYYDKAVQHFTQNPDEIFMAWDNPDAHVFGKLFQYLCCKSAGMSWRNSQRFGCPTMIKYEVDYNEEALTFVAESQALTEMCKEAELPNMSKYVWREDSGRDLIPYLKTFAEIQRAADKELGRQEPVTD